MPRILVVERRHLWIYDRAITAERDRIASGFYDDPLMADRLEGDAVITIHEDVPTVAGVPRREAGL